MRLFFDIHTHTLASVHAYSTLEENIKRAKIAGLLAYGFSDHAPGMPNTTCASYFNNFKVIPNTIDGMRILKGIEANITDYNGNMDISSSLAKKLDYVIASLHISCIKPGDIEQNTSAIIGAMKNPYVRIIGHPDDGQYPIDMEKVVQASIDNDVVLELNNASLKPDSVRINGRNNAKEMLNICKRQGCCVVCGTDSHISFDIGDFKESIELVDEIGFPEELVLNSDMSGLKKIIIS